MLVSEGMLSEVLSQLVVVLGDRARWANTLWSTARLVDRDATLLLIVPKYRGIFQMNAITLSDKIIKV